MGSARAWLGLAVASALLTGGCLEPSVDDIEPGSLLLDVLLRNVGEGTREGGLGPHCATARVEEDRVVVEQESTRVERGGPVLWLRVRHDWESGWMAVSADGHAMPLRHGPAFVSPVVDGNLSHVAVIAWDGEAAPEVDGRPVSLPHSWTYRSPDGRWEADLRLEEGPRKVVWRGPAMRSCA